MEILAQRFIVSIFILAAAAATAAAAPPPAPPLILKRVLLSTGGVGYFEHEALVDGDAELQLEVRLDQVDDVLKSIIVYDDTGRVGTVRLPGREPLRQAFRDLPFDQAALKSPSTLLQALQGAEISATGPGGAQGRILSVTQETMALPDTRAVVRHHRVTLNTPEGLRHFVLEDARAVRFVDPKLEGQVQRALAAVARHRVRDRRVLRIAVSGTRKRRVRVAYVVAAPLWKASYRLTVSDGAKAEKGHLQGWAVIENMSGQPWRDVELTLVSGNPVTFRQAIYASYYVNRPEVPVEVLGRVLPRPDTGDLAADESGMAPRDALHDKREERSKRGRARNYAAPGLVSSNRSMRLQKSVAMPNQSARIAVPVASRESATQVLFRVPRPLSIETGHSLVVPIIFTPIPARRIALYQPATHGSHPLASVRLVNSAKTGLPGGVLTLYERGSKSGRVSYLGDAQLRTVPPGENRLVSFALDGKTKIESHASNAENISTGTIRRGVFRFSVVDRRTVTYRLRAPRRAARIVVLEQPRPEGWKLTAPGDARVTLAPGLHRIEISLKAGENRKLKVVSSRPRTETLRLSNLNADRVAAYARAPQLDAAVRKAFARMAKFMKSIVSHKGDAARLTREQKVMFQDQKRIRENMRRISNNSRLYKRYSTKLAGQEDRLDAITGEIEAAHKAVRKAQSQLADYIGSLDG